MSLIPEPIPIADDEENQEFFYLSQLRAVVSAARNLSFTSREGAMQHNDKAGNLNAVWVVFTSNATSNTEDEISHGLGRTPVGILASIPDKSATVYVSTAATSTKLFLKTTAPNVSWKLLVF